MNKILKPIRSIFSDKTAASPSRTPAASDDQAGPFETALPASQSATLQHLFSDQPNALKFQVDRPLLAIGEKRVYASAEECSSSPLAASIFSTGGIESITLESIFITVEMAENSDWEQLMKSVPAAIVNFFEAGGEPLAEAAQGPPKKKHNFGFKQITGRPREEQMRIVKDFFDNEVNPSIAAHGGYFTLLDIQDNKVYVELGGGCQGCSMANVTLRQGVESRLNELLPEMAALIDSTDHAAGTNPFYQQSKK